MRKVLFIVAGLLLVIVSCKNDVEINAPWRETPVIYALLDMGQDTQIFRIQKTYQNSLNQTASEVAQISDSLYLKNISVKVFNINNTDTSTNYTYFKRTKPLKNPGFYSNLDSSFWEGSIKVIDPKPIYTYGLEVTNTQTGKVYKGLSNLVDTAIINTPPNLTPAKIDLTKMDAQFFINVANTGKNSKVFDVILRLNYTEAPANNPNATTHKYLDYVLKQTQVVASGNAGTNSNSRVDNKLYLDFIKSRFKTNNIIVRKLRDIEVVVVAGNSDFYELMLVEKPSGSIISKSGQYSNISDAIGIFASRTTTKKKQDPLPQTFDLLNNTVLNP